MKQLPYFDPHRVALLHDAMAQRILLLDGAMGTMLQTYKLDESGYRGERFVNGEDLHHGHGHACDLKGNNDLLSLSQPEIVRAVHRAYLEAGADMLETNTFNATRISQADYHLEHLVTELNRDSARIVREECDAFTAKNPAKPRFCVGVLGPTNRTASMSPDVNNPGFRNVAFDDLTAAYRESTEALLDGGADIIMVETIFDTLNAKAALFAIDEVYEARGARWPIMISGTITDMSGRTLSGQTPEAFYNSVRHAQPLAIGLNCALGATELRAYIDMLAQIAECAISAHPNAGLPNAFGEYDETPEQMSAIIGEFARAGLVDVVGGCCGTTPAHIRAIAAAVAHIPPRRATIAAAQAAEAA